MNVSSLHLLDVLLTALGVTLAAVAVILTGVAILVAIFGLWGYRDVKRAAVRAAVDAAVREVGQYLQMEQNGPATQESHTVGDLSLKGSPDDHVEVSRDDDQSTTKE